MAIPGMRADVPVRGKLRCGIKGKSSSGREIPKSVDYFVSDDSEFAAKLGEQPRRVPIHFLHPVATDNFRTGLEQWEGKLLLCYNDGSKGENVALRRRTMKKGSQDVNTLDGFEVIDGEVIGNERCKVVCRDRACPMMTARPKKCKPTGRLEFFVDGFARTDGLFQFITHSWNSIEKVQGFLSLVDGDATKHQFYLCVKWEQRGRDKFPVVWLEADVYEDADGNVVIENAKDIQVADALIALRAAVDTNNNVRPQFAAYLDVVMPEWKQNEALISKIKEMGVEAAAQSALAKAGF